MSASDDPFSRVQPGALVAVADGASAPVELFAALSHRAREIGTVRLLLGWSLTPLDALDLDAFASVTVVMGGYFTTPLLRSHAAHYVPVRFGALRSVLTSQLRPDVLIAAVVDRRDGWHFTTDVGWQRVLVDAGIPIIGVVRPGPSGDGGVAIPSSQLALTAVDSNRYIPAESSPLPSNPLIECVAEHVVGLIKPGVRLQYAPGAMGAEVLRQLEVPVQLDTGVLGDISRELDERGLLSGTPIAPYCIGDDATLAWVDRKRSLAGVEVTHDPARLVTGPPFVAVNTALQIDRDGQVGIEVVNGRIVAGIGGQPDYMSAATVSPEGISVVALPTTHARRPTMVDHLDGAVSTASHDVDVVVTENGVGWLRGLDRAGRRRELARLWGA